MRRKAGRKDASLSSIVLVLFLFMIAFYTGRGLFFLLAILGMIHFSREVRRKRDRLL